jgi:hypothetical protein
LTENQEVVSSILTWGASLPHSSMAEQAAVNRAVVGSSPTEAAIHCRVDELVSRIALNDEVAGSIPALAIKPCGVIGNIAPFEGEDSRFDPWWGCQTYSCSPTGRDCRLKNSLCCTGSIPVRSTRYRDVIQWSRSLVLGTRSRRFKSYHPDHLPL